MWTDPEDADSAVSVGGISACRPTRHQISEPEELSFVTSAEEELFPSDAMPIIAEVRRDDARKARQRAEQEAVLAQGGLGAPRVAKLLAVGEADEELREEIRLRILREAYLRSGEVNANDLRAWAKRRYADVWSIVDRIWSAQWSVLSTRRLIEAAGRHVPNLDFDGSNDNKNLPVWRITAAGRDALRRGATEVPKARKAAAPRRAALPAQRTGEQLAELRRQQQLDFEAQRKRVAAQRLGRRLSGGVR